MSEETFRMSLKELDRTRVMEQMDAGALTLQEAA